MLTSNMRKSRISSQAKLLALLVWALASACSAGEEGSGRGVLVVAIDELRADHMSAYGYDRATTPNLDQLVDKGVLFSRAFSTAPLLIPSHTSLMTGCYPVLSRRRIPKNIKIPESNRWRIPEVLPRLSMEFLAAGYSTAAFLDTEALNNFGGYDHGFQVFERDDPQNWRNRKERGGGALSKALRAWLSDLPADQNWFAYLHIRDLSRVWRESNAQWDEYFPMREGPTFVPPTGATDDVFFSIPRSRWSGWPRTMALHEQRYDGAVRRIDELLGRLFRNLEVEQLWSKTTVCVVGTYGLQFGENGLFFSSGLLSVAELQVPWILKLAPEMSESGERAPLGTHEGRHLDHLASLVDVAPTLLEWEGIPIPSGTHGLSHLPLLRGEVAEIRPYAFASGGVADGSVVFGEEWAFEELRFDVRSPDLIKQWFGTAEPAGGLTESRFYRYDAELAGGESTSTGDVPEATAEELKQAVATWLGNLSDAWEVLQASHELSKVSDRATIERLEELGYIGEQR